MLSNSIFSYCVPDEDFEFDWLENFHGFKLDEQEEYFDFFDRINHSVESYFRKALEEMAPLLEDISIQEIHLVSDYLGMLCEPQTLAHWNYHRSKIEKGHYLLVASPALINFSLKLMENPSHPAGGTIGTTWQHELIHLADQEAILHAANWLKYGSDRMIRRKYLSDFRAEGIADLWFLGKGHSIVNTLEAGRERFQKDLHRISMLDPTSFSTRKKYGDAVKAVDYLYSAGPMMVLHALSVCENKKTCKQAQDALSKIENGTVFSNEELFVLIQSAIQMNADTFIKNLMVNGTDGKPFLKAGELESLISYKK